MNDHAIILPDIQAAPVGAPMRGNRMRGLFEPLLAHQRILRQIVETRLDEWLGVTLLDLRNPSAARDQALARTRNLPERSVLHAWDDELCSALDGEADEKTLSVLLAILLDGFPRSASQNPDAYVDAAILILGDQRFSPDSVAAAIVRIWRKNKFAPSLSELIDECDEAKQAASLARRVATKMLALLDNAEDALTATGDLKGAG